MYKDIIFDVDGVLNTGQFLYDSEGKKYKMFGPDDADAIKILRNYITVYFVSGDKRGFPISQARVNDMGFPLEKVSTFDRLTWIRYNFSDLSTTIYMGDSFMDIPICKSVGYSIAPHNANSMLLPYVNYVTNHNGGDRAVSDACFHILSILNINIDFDNLVSYFKKD
jgi:3-deoxy-D-manno-octulosonate 8-phosphate phosphatase (KDO 8-P phosphatase)